MGKQPAEAKFHEDYSRAAEVKSGSDRSFGLVFAGFFTLVGLGPLRHHLPVRGWGFVLAAAFLVVALTRPSLLRPLNAVWFRVGLLLHRVMNPLIMGVIFFVFFAPMAFLLRVAGKKLLRLGFEPSLPSYWIKRDPPGPAPDTMARQF